MGHRPLRVRVAACITRGDEILLVIHEKGDHRYRLLPGGGVEEGETMVAALVREIREETGFRVDVGNLVVVCEAIDPREERHLLNMVFRCEVVDGELRVGADGVLCDVEWAPRACLHTIELYPAIGGTIADCWDEQFGGQVRVLGNVWRDAPRS